MTRATVAVLLAWLALTQGVPPCCVITAIDLRKAQVTAQESSTGHRFRFELKEREQLRKLKVGQKIWADFAAGTVTLDPQAKPCCSILKSTPGGTDP